MNPFNLVYQGVGEVIQPDDPRHPKNQETLPENAPLDEPTPTNPEE
jgi:hypothetical protein